MVLTLAGGFLFGALHGTALTIVGASTGATLVFLFARYLMGERAVDQLGPQAAALADWLRRNAWSYLLALRLVPLFPFFLVNLVPAFVGVRLPVYVLTTFFGIMPGTAVYSLAGAGLGSVFEFADDGTPPGLWTLALSQVTTWIFARSLLNAAILGYLFGIAGTLAYAAYYGSFLVGARIVDALRFRHGHESVQSYMRSAFGRLGVLTYNLVVALRLMSEVFANLLVVGIIFGAAGTAGYVAIILAVSGITLGYAMIGGLCASLRTDVVQMWLLIALLLALTALTLGADGFNAGAVMTSSPDLLSPGWALLVVALLQVWSYPLHDPVMMDRGFLADRDVTRRSFLHAFWISTLCILAFGMIGVHAGLHRLGDEALLDTLGRLMSPQAILLVNLALIVSALSTLDSALSSASKLAISDMRLASPTLRNGRIAMAIFMAGGLSLLFLGNQDLFSAVAASGTASMFLAPVVFFCIWGGWQVPQWSYAMAFALAMAAAAVYFLDTAGHMPVFKWAFGPLHDHTKLLAISVVVLSGGCIAFGLQRAQPVGEALSRRWRAGWSARRYRPASATTPKRGRLFRG